MTNNTLKQLGNIESPRRSSYINLFTLNVSCTTIHVKGI